MDDDAGRDAEPITPEQLADLQAGLLDDESAAALRQRVRTDPEAAAVLASLDQVRRDLAHLGADASSAPEVPAAVSTRIGAALRAQQRTPAHSVRDTPRWQLIALVAGVCAAVLGAVVGWLMLARDPAPRWTTGPTAESIATRRPATGLPLSNPQIVALLSQHPDYGPLTDPGRRAVCLSALGYSDATPVLGARPVDMNGRPAMLLVLPADTPGTVVALVVESNCNAGHSGLLASASVTRP